MNERGKPVTALPRVEADLSLLRIEVRNLAQALAEFSRDVTECRPRPPGPYRWRTQSAGRTPGACPRRAISRGFGQPEDRTRIRDSQ